MELDGADRRKRAMKTIRQLAFLLLLATVTLTPWKPVKASVDACAQCGDMELGSVRENCYPEDPLFCEVGDNYCWQIAPQYSCESWYGICWDGDNPCDYFCCCSQI
jgi:hypothetical protein